MKLQPTFDLWGEVCVLYEVIGGNDVFILTTTVLLSSNLLSSRIAIGWPGHWPQFEGPVTVRVVLVVGIHRHLTNRVVQFYGFTSTR